MTQANHQTDDQASKSAVKLTPQLPLGLQLREELSFSSYYTAANKLAVEAAQAAARGDELFVYLCGPAETGKSHLLQAAVREALDAGVSAFYLSLENLSRSDFEFSPDVLPQLAEFELVCIDNIGAIAGFEDWQNAVFALFNQLREKNHSLMVADLLAPAQLDLALADLQSRLSWGLSITLRTLSDAEKQQILQHCAVQRGFQLPDDVASYLLVHLPRSLNLQLAWLHQLDRAALASRRRLTIPFVKAVLTA